MTQSRSMSLIEAVTNVALGYPYLANDMVKGNFSNSRLALIEFRRRVSAWQHSVMVWQLCRPVYARWMDAAVLSGALALPGYEATDNDPDDNPKDTEIAVTDIDDGETDTADEPPAVPAPSPAATDQPAVAAPAPAQDAAQSGNPAELSA